MRVAYAALAEPRRPETIVLLLDARHRGSVVLVCADASRPSQVLQLAALLLEVAAATPPLRAVVLATARPGAGIVPSADDEDAFATMRDELAEADIELLDWFLVDADLVGSVAELTGACWLWQGPEPPW
jgi:hypothetical protein